MRVSLPVTGLTPFHALNDAHLKINEFLLVFGASGNWSLWKYWNDCYTACEEDRSKSYS
jgi:hypothetical protein